MESSDRLNSMHSDLPLLDPPERLLCGPGPTNVEPAVLAAMGRPMLGHLDPDLHEILLEVVSMLRRAYRMPDGLVLPLHCTGMAGMEAGIANLLEPGDTAIVARAGFFGGRISEIARRHGVDVIEVEAEWGEAVPNERILRALDEHPAARLVAVVHAETSTGVEHPLAELGAALRGRDTLLMADCVTSLGGVELDLGAWGVDYAYSCTQKCLAAPPGMSPVAVSEAGLERIRARTQPVPFSFDLLLLERYWITRPPAYHHTAPILHIYALHEALRLVLEEGLEARWARHAEAGEYLRQAIAERGLETLADPARQLAPLTAVRVPEGVDGKAVQGRLLRRHGIEVGGGLGPTAPPMWRIGLMGRNADVEIADRVLAALDEELAEAGRREPVLAG
jgi:alanine-glyoxylate transaminase / serine-glyoxylate transaminase / serine-pyruvate transaminase